MKKIVTKTVEMKVAEYIKYHNEKYAEPINRHDVYKKIKDGVLKAKKGYKNAWIIETEIQEEVEVEDTKPAKKSSKKTYTLKEFAAAYNEKHPSNLISTPELRKLIADGKLDAEKVSGKWVISNSPRKRLK